MTITKSNVPRAKLALGRRIVRIRFSTCFTTIALVFFGILVSSSVASGQEQNATPSDNPAEVDSPRFALVPVGDYPDGFFRDIEVAPGSSVELTVAVVNSGDIPVTLQTYKSNALSSVNGGFVAGAQADPPIGLTAWMDYPTTTLELEPKAQHEIAFTVSVPDDAKPGQYVSGLVAETAEALPIPGSATFDQKLGYVISISILIPGEMSGNFELGKPEVSGEGSLRRLRVPITNTGNYLVRPTGELTLTNTDGEQILRSKVEMGSLYGGLSTSIEVALPEQMPYGDYSVDLSLTDEESGAHDEISDVTVSLVKPEEPAVFSITDVAVVPNADPIVFADVAVTLNNGGQQLPATDVTLQVLRDGEEVEQFPLATNQVLPSGETELTARYLPAEAWELGTYTFKVIVSAVDPQGGSETILATIDVKDEIVVP